MSAALITPPYPGEPPRKRFTRAEIDQLIDAGFFVDERFELIEGDLIDKTGQKPPHAAAIRLLKVLLAGIFGLERVQAQLPIESGSADWKWSLPEPDLAVFTENKPEFATRFPSGTELTLLIEVADSTVRHDLTTKRNLYARAGVVEYWVLDLRRRCLVVHRQVTGANYAQVMTSPKRTPLVSQAKSFQLRICCLLQLSNRRSAGTAAGRNGSAPKRYKQP